MSDAGSPLTVAGAATDCRNRRLPCSLFPPRLAPGNQHARMLHRSGNCVKSAFRVRQFQAGVHGRCKFCQTAGNECRRCVVLVLETLFNARRPPALASIGRLEGIMIASSLRYFVLIAGGAFALAVSAPHYARAVDTNTPAPNPPQSSSAPKAGHEGVEEKEGAEEEGGAEIGAGVHRRLSCRARHDLSAARLHCRHRQAEVARP